MQYVFVHVFREPDEHLCPQRWFGFAQPCTSPCEPHAERSPFSQLGETAHRGALGLPIYGVDPAHVKQKQDRDLRGIKGMPNADLPLAEKDVIYIYIYHSMISYRQNLTLHERSRSCPSFCAQCVTSAPTTSVLQAVVKGLGHVNNGEKHEEARYLFHKDP